MAVEDGSWLSPAANVSSRLHAPSTIQSQSAPIGQTYRHCYRSIDIVSVRVLLLHPLRPWCVLHAHKPEELNMQPWALVSPASRGIGLELARRLLQTTKVPIVASARKDLDQTRENILQGLDGVSEERLHVLKIDVLGRCLAVFAF